MSNLPHPLGDSSVGDLFYPGSPQVTVADAAGPAGSRAVEYGEDGLSAAVNRGLYALGKNEEHIQARMEAPIAKPQFTTFVPAGGNGDVYAFPTVDLWVGDATYLPETQAIRDSLFSLLDASYNDLLDSSGNRVVVKEVRNAGDTSSIVGDTGGAGGDDDGFYNVGGGALIRFKTVHPRTGADITSPYTIPDATGVIIAHGISGAWDMLATVGSEHLMRDALVKSAIRNAHEIHGAVFLTDGTRKMIGPLNMDGQDLQNVVGVTNSPGSPMAFISDDDINLKDQYLASPTPLSEAGQTAIYAPPGSSWTSLVGALNSKTRVNESLHGNRPLDTTGSLVYADGTGLVTYSTLNVCINGDHVIIPGGNFTAANGSFEMMVIDAAGAVQQRAASAGVAGDIPISYHYWTGAAFTTKLDIRWAMSGRTSVFDITVGLNTDGADFATLKEAVDYCNAAQFVGNMAVPNRILVVGDTTIGEQIEITTPLRIEGRADAGATFPTVTCTGDAAIHAIDCNGWKVEITDLQMTWGHSTDQNTGLGAIHDPGDGSRIIGVTMSGSGGFFWANGITVSSSDRTRLFFQDCYFLDVLEYGIDGADKFNTTKVLKCRFGTTGTTGIVAMRLRSTWNVVEECIVDALSYAGGLILGPGGTAIRNKMVGDTAGTGIVLDDTALTGAWEWTVEDNRITTFLRGIDINTSVVIEPHVIIDKNYIAICTIGIQFNNNSSLDSLSDFTVQNNTFDGCTNSGINVAAASYTANLHIIGNQFRSQGGTSIWLRGYTISMFVERNTSLGFGTGVGDSALKIDLDGQFHDIQVIGNLFQTTPGQSTSARIVEVSQTNKILFRGNEIGSSSVRMIGIDASGAGEVSGMRFEGNKFVNTSTAIAVSTLTADRGAEITNNVFDDFTSYAVVVFGGRGIKINGNTFRDGTGRAIEVSSDGTHVVNGCNIVGNTCENVDGLTSGVGQVFSTSSSNIRGLNIVANNFFDCGDTSGGHDSYIIAVYVPAQIKGNYIYQMKGPDGTATEFTAAIYTSSTGVLIEGNTLVQDISVGAVEELVGIWVDANNCQIVSNRLQITGTIATMTSCRAIWAANASDTANDQHIISNNYFSEFTATGATDFYIRATGDYITAVGNTAFGFSTAIDIDISGGTGGAGMVVANRISSLGAVLVGVSHYPIAGTLRADLNS